MLFSEVFAKLTIVSNRSQQVPEELLTIETKQGLIFNIFLSDVQVEDLLVSACTLWQIYRSGQVSHNSADCLW